MKKEIPKEEQTSLVLDEGTRPPTDEKEFEWKQPVATATIQETRPWLDVPVEDSFSINYRVYPGDEATWWINDSWQFINPFSDSDDEPDESNQMIETNVDTVEKGNVSVESRVPRIYPIGQMHGTYIFAQNENGLYIIDQHAAQERLKYEYFREKVGQVQSELQEMLVPLTFEYSTDEFLKINEYQD